MQLHWRSFVGENDSDSQVALLSYLLSHRQMKSQQVATLAITSVFARLQCGKLCQCKLILKNGFFDKTKPQIRTRNQVEGGFFV